MWEGLFSTVKVFVAYFVAQIKPDLRKEARLDCALQQPLW